MSTPPLRGDGRSPSARRTRPSGDQVRDGLAHVCERLDDLRDRLRRYGDTESLNRLTERLRDGEEAVADDVLTIHRTVLAHEGRGIYGAVRGVDNGRLPGGDDPRPASVVHLCPQGRCSRLWLPHDGDGPVPDCAVFGVRLKQERLY
ncbi:MULTISPECIES: hypothetical protein [Streptomyces]|uniref:Uncharacterized protein n=1 Tax=Streptomyces edwardsiae TaxID=3075527 RepID=A0ABU2QEL2_9ACTN|nr:MULTISPECIES: hypothetical protein [unclassified Streptomyces]MDT0402861.1 hypothetical protein [Streptomyces sp. DSM 41635]